MTGVLIHRTNDVEDSLFTMHSTVIKAFESMVLEFRQLLESDRKCIIFCPLSFGKDSSVVTLAAKEAYRQCIAEGTIEAARPFIVSTGDPKAEAMQMRMYSRWAAPKLKAYAKEHGINLYFDFVEPTFTEEYANRYLTSNKLIPNATRSGDCSVILKVIPSERYVKSILKRFEGDSELAEYADYNVICATGQRNEESTRRASNMKLQGTAEKTVAQVFDEVNKSDIKTSYPLYLYAPIRDWSTDEVFCALELAGEKPLTRNLLGQHNAIRGFLPDFALLLAIYGNASKDACEISVGKKVSAGCNGKSRYGCMICTMVTTDKTQIALSEHPRWAALLQEEVLRVRDYMFRLSTKVNARMMHAKAIDYACHSRIALQPNVLRVQYLEKLVRYFSQLSIESKRRADDFKKLVEQGRESEHEGVQDIMADVTLNAKARRAMLSMYIEQAQEPMIELFSQRHAVYLSFRWSLDGVSSIPYRPLAIWEGLSEDKGWIPYPKTNEEYEAVHGKIALIDKKKGLPEAVMLPVFKQDGNVERFLQENKSLMSFWSRPRDISDVLAESNCTVVNVHTASTPVQGTIDHNVELTFDDVRNSDMSFSGFAGGCHQPLFGVNWSQPKLLKLTINNRKAPARFTEHFQKRELERVFKSLLDNWFQEVDHQLDTLMFRTLDEVKDFANNSFNQAFGKSVLNLTCFLDTKQMTPSYLDVGRKAAPSIDFTKRVTKKSGDQFTRGLTRLSFYGLELKPRLHYAKTDNASLLVPDLQMNSESIKDVYTPAYYVDPTPELGENLNVIITKRGISRWVAVGGAKAALEMHDQTLQRRIANRHTAKGKYSIRGADCCSIAESMVEQGAVMLDRKYLPTFKQLAHRTHLFNEIGAFDYQNYTAEELHALPFTVDMKQHRSDKALVLMKVRAERNAMRKQIKAQLADPTINVLDRLEFFFENNRDCTLAYFGATFIKHHRGLFSTQNVGHLSATAEAWLHLYGDSFNSVESLLKLLLNKEQIAYLNSNLPAKRKVYGAVHQHLGDVIEFIDEAVSLWAPVNKAVKSIRTEYQDSVSKGLPELMANKEATLGVGDMKGWNQYKKSEGYKSTQELTAEIVSEYAVRLGSITPDTALTIAMDIQRNWRPNLITLDAELGLMIDDTDRALEQLTELRSRAGALIRVGLRQVVSGMTLEQRLDSSVADSSVNVPISKIAVRSEATKEVVASKKAARKTKAKPSNLLAALLSAA